MINPKSENRDPKEIRNPKPEIRKIPKRFVCSERSRSPSDLGFWISPSRRPVPPR